MKNKKLTYILIPLTLAIWGIIIYRVMKTADGSDGQLLIQESTIVDTGIKAVVRDTFALRLNYRDPFLGKTAAHKNINRSATEPVQNSAPTTITNVSTPKQTSWPVINYNGLIKSNVSNKLLAFVKINGQGNMMKEGDAIAGVKLLRVYRDSIEVQFDKQKRFIRK